MGIKVVADFMFFSCSDIALYWSFKLFLVLATLRSCLTSIENTLSGLVNFRTDFFVCNYKIQNTN